MTAALDTAPRGPAKPAAKADASLSPDDLGATLADLRRDVGDLVASIRKAAVDRGDAMVEDIAGGVNEATRVAARRGRESRVAVEQAVQDNPMMALGLAAGLGLLFGLALRR